ncbi:Oidioi.mRNA.OKI2018_I69.XSR.g16572.t1.cds [Oikopleura dioica]|uniref:Oidioi.mRNA.OKI2018_I69.XSR.g16572.t1.cds n=1 Tax=Oikopleura dioica TaxID=34765 RepID=A0ABN7SH08_OIKDI|nr:Oidioi.mRNA.OKI2018_I69.XSR.g16572.t1.cds [Oikopleura dioica]
MAQEQRGRSFRRSVSKLLGKLPLTKSNSSSSAASRKASLEKTPQAQIISPSIVSPNVQENIQPEICFDDFPDVPSHPVGSDEDF